MSTYSKHVHVIYNSEEQSLLYCFTIVVLISLVYFRLKIMMEKKKIGAILIYEFKMGHKPAETVYNINQAFSQDIIGKCPV